MQGLFQNLGNQRSKRRKLRIKDALSQIRDEEAAKRVNEEDLKLRALEIVEQNGIVFLDELDKVGAEIMYGERELVNGSDGDFTRVMFSAKYAF
mgnify:CR=1 FL=1